MITALTKLPESGPHGPPTASDEPTPACGAYKCTDDLHGQDMRCGRQHMTNERGDHSMSDLQEFFNKMLAGTTARPTQTAHEM